MRIAIQLAGQFRSWRDLEEQFYKNVIQYNVDKGHDVDIFVHGYNDKNYPGNPFQWIQPTASVMEDMESIYTPPQYLNTEWNHDVVYHHYRKVHDCNTLRKTYEQTHHITYDLIFKTRFDLIYYQPVHFPNLLPPNHIICGIDANPGWPPSDACYMCSPETMDEMCRRLQERDFVVCGHTILRQFNPEETISIDIVRFFENGEPRFAHVFYNDELADKHYVRPHSQLCTE